MKKTVLLTAGLALIIAAGAYFYTGNGSREGAASDSALDTTALKQMVQDYSSRTLTAESASISSTQLIVKETDGKSASYSLPEDEFFVSIAPYVNKTHPCAIHSLTGCQGELVEEEFSVSVQDAEGNQVMDRQTVKSQPNGFIDLWLPRDKTYNVTIEQNGKKAESEISTFEQNDTCVATMQLD
ncbi:hypothetical protein R70723_27580 [Paenibacillus sp. FSL R7-0273]|uniref:CueP family metal-binding protein n=1 Tax=Paenibacillus sp. FSL R7-0273 TaxID=1536772 RepID=UPI0004F6383B|nr:CueP family metal-binding protein [Paenibacillus sp. FSL R7-0273]AIQ49243.1 hypothetical protein R70723_27580 [Paenibacillus sp. FSL R7-0273]OMF83903.1 hypothetical protein BK144_31125 [Paenibacillus sp. FSL R7-0273]